MEMRIALLHSGHLDHAKVVELAKNLGRVQVEIDLACAGEQWVDGLADCDLILVEAFDQVSLNRPDLLTRIRLNNLAPVVLLTSAKTEGALFEGLVAGADAAIPLGDGAEVTIAHCRALLRRWRMQ